jgi:hypothetical protein
MHDDAREMKAAGSIGSATNQGHYPDGVEIDLPRDGTIKGSERPYRKNILRIIVGYNAL